MTLVWLDTPFLLFKNLGNTLYEIRMPPEKSKITKNSTASTDRGNLRGNRISINTETAVASMHATINLMYCFEPAYLHKLLYMPSAKKKMINIAEIKMLSINAIFI